MHQDQTIIAQCTPQGSGALALLRLSGGQALSIAQKMSRLSQQKNLKDVASHTIHMGHVVDGDGEPIDQVMFSIMHAPRTFTGEHVVEITTHNNPFIIQAVIDQAIKHGARLAQEGEFCKRAVLNGKIDLVQAEAINELIHAHSQQALKLSLAQVRGSFSCVVHTLQENLIKALAFCQASFEFIDEEHMTFGDRILEIIHATLATIDQLKVSFDQQQRIRDGIRIALIGSVNAGKSSLFNALLQKDRAIVTHIAGTTRDVIEAGVYKADNYWTLIDTAGLRQTTDAIEQEGIDRSYQEAQRADIILLVIDQSRAITQEEQVIYQELVHRHEEKIVTLYSKADLPAVLKRNVSELSVSNVSRVDIGLVEQEIEKKISHITQGSASPYLLNKRQFNLLLALECSLQEVLPLMQNNIAYELVSVHLQEAVAHMSELTGKSISEAGMDKVFREFCVGK